MGSGSFSVPIPSHEEIHLEPCRERNQLKAGAVVEKQGAGGSYAFPSMHHCSADYISPSNAECLFVCFEQIINGTSEFSHVLLQVYLELALKFRTDEMKCMIILYRLNARSCPVASAMLKNHCLKRLAKACQYGKAAKSGFLSVCGHESE